MDALSRMNNALAYIEEHLTEDIDYSEISKTAFCSEYHFKRMFSFLSGISLSEYIRRRRLTLAALDLKARDLRIIDVAVKYGMVQLIHSPVLFMRCMACSLLKQEVRTHN